ncbi:DUF6894 family protein [Methylorubrum extorquens]|uniref:DUF6894 domain-containing protein n=1 Tax=Methylorubrum extorquens (strain CM4 / NCIMB 13688) TaxID=440085 RepID=B7L1S3_METC4|nr:hypothetical protein [Methylorubrum extorquens]ACK81467.1 hypothetical protein Mchl_0535 [Methylorubrum extorquens CM4]
MPRFFFDIDDGEKIRDAQAFELTDLYAVRTLAQRTAAELIAHDLQKTAAIRVRVDVRNESGKHVLSALGYGAVLIAATADAQDGTEASDEVSHSSPLDRATRHAIAARRAIDEDGSASLRHLVNMLMHEIGRTVARRLCAAEHKRMRPEKGEDFV